MASFYEYSSTFLKTASACIFTKYSSTGPGRPSPEQKFRDINLNFSGALPKNLQWNIDFSGGFGYFSRYFLRDDSFLSFILEYYIIFLQMYSTK